MLSEKSLIRESEPQNFLLVEGKDDEHVFYSLLKHHQIPKRFEIKNKESINKLLDSLEVELLSSDLRRLGIVVDADTDVAARWQALRDRLIKSGYNAVPVTPNLKGTIIKEEELPIVGIWLMPDNTIPGMLENFVSFLVPPDDSLWPMAEDVLQKVIEKDCRFRDTYQMKARLHTWLAWQEQPGTPLGLAITNRYLDANAPHAQQLMDWIRQLFDLESA
jgi:hypothetical protein